MPYHTLSHSKTKEAWQDKLPLLLTHFNNFYMIELPAVSWVPCLLLSMKLVPSLVIAVYIHWSRHFVFGSYKDSCSSLIIHVTDSFDGSRTHGSRKLLYCGVLCIVFVSGQLSFAPDIDKKNSWLATFNLLYKFWGYIN